MARYALNAPLTSTGRTGVPEELRALPLLLKVAEVASLLRTSPKAIYAQIERGLLPGVVRVGRRVLVRRDALAVEFFPSEVVRHREKG